MKITFDLAAKTLARENGDQRETLPLYSREAFEILSGLWLKVGWNEKYPYTFSWFGRPVIQAPEDIVRMQEVIHHLRPDLIIETGVAHGGSLIFYASLMKALDLPGRIIGVDIEIRPHNRAALEAHPLYGYLTLVEGSSIDPALVRRVHDLARGARTVLVVLDSCHTKAHVAAELAAYHDLVTPGSYIVATDGSMQDLWDVPRGQPAWKDDHPAAAAREFAATHPEFTIVQPEWPFNESTLRKNITHWPDAWLLRR
jgi:cephalosporin hydroxylase